MKLKNSDEDFGWIAIGVHWLVAIVVFGLFGLGLYMTSLTYYDPWYRFGPFLHEGIGVALLLAMIFRLYWRLTNPVPQPEPGMADWEIAVAHATHWILYLLLFAVMISGYFISTAKGQGLNVFDLFKIPAIYSFEENMQDLAGTIHLYIAYALVGLAGLHTAAALKHHFIERDRTLIRMIKPTDGRPSAAMRRYQ